MPIFQRFLQIIGTVTRTVILVPHPIAIGNFCEEMYFGILKARRENKKLLLILPFQLPGHLRLNLHGNREVLQLRFSTRSSFHDSGWYVAACWFVTLYFGFFRAISIVTNSLMGVQLPEEYVIPMLGQETLWQPEVGMTNFSWDLVEQYRWTEQTQAPLQIDLSEHQRSKAEILRQRIGLPKGVWFACLHVRDGGYYEDQRLTSSRNANIENYISAIQEITGRGGWVIRMGDTRMPKLPQLERVIDYPFTEAKCPLMDIYLVKECRVYVGMISGILDMAMLFHRPIVLTNMPNWLWSFPQKAEDMGIFRPLYSKAEQRFVPPLEWPTLPWGDHNEFAPAGGYEYGENTTEELRAVVAEHFERGNQWVPTAAQLQFKQLRIDRGRKLIGCEMIAGNTIADIKLRYRFAARLESASGVLGAEFLEHSGSPKHNTWN